MHFKVPSFGGDLGEAFLFPEINLKQIQRTGGNAQFANDAFLRIELQFPVDRIHLQRTGKTNRSTVSATDTADVVPGNFLVKWFTTDIVCFQICDSILQIGGRTFQFQN